MLVLLKQIFKGDMWRAVAHVFLKDYFINENQHQENVGD